MGLITRARLRLPLTALLLAGAVAASAAPAEAAAWRCEAGAITGSLLNGAVELPAVKANPGAIGCVSQTAGAGVALPAPLHSAAVVAQTTISGADAAAQKVVAVGGVADLRVKALPELPVTLPAIEVPAALSALQVDLSAIPDPLNLIPSSLSLDLRPAIDALKPARLLPDVDLLRVQGAVAYAAAQCVAGVPKVAGVSHVAGISALGQTLPTGRAVDQSLTLLDSGSIDPSNVDLSKVALPDGILDLPVVGELVRQTIQTALDALPAIAIPATLAQVEVTPGEQTTAGGLLTQRALRVQVGIAGQSIVDATVGEASAGAGDVDCAPAPPAENPALECTRKSLVLVDVYQRKGRVQLLGAADRKFAGRTVSIVFEATGRVVAKAKVAADGGFETTARLPSRRLRSGNDARYMAVIGKERSMNLKLARRMIVSRMLSRDGRVVIDGRVTGPLAKGAQRSITVTRRVSCTKSERIGTFRPRTDGTFSIRFDAPRNSSTAVYRLSTRVRKTPQNAKTFPTYTLPRAINLLGL